MSGKKLLYSVHTISKYTKLQSWIQIEEEKKFRVDSGYRYYKISEMDTS